jgi:hypothetical protein
MLQNVQRFLQWMSWAIHIDTWDILLVYVSRFRTLHSGMYRHVMFRAIGRYVAASMCLCLPWSWWRAFPPSAPHPLAAAAQFSAHTIASLGREWDINPLMIEAGPIAVPIGGK